MKVTVGCVIPMVLCAFAEAEDKNPYWLFNPTPRHLMRDMATDRPDKTESPYTVDAGHFQVEMDVLNYSYDRDNGLPGDTRIESLSIAPVNLKVGLCNRADLQLMLEPYTHVRTHLRTERHLENQRGFGDTTVRLKANIWGNDEGATAFGAIPYVKLPTNQDRLGNNSVEGGLIIPFTADLPGGWGMGVMTQFDYNRDETGRGHHPEFVNSITFGHHIARDMAAYLEFFSAVSTERGSEWIGTIDFGFTYGLTPDIQLDCGMNVGVTRSADDLNPFLGISWRF